VDAGGAGWRRGRGRVGYGERRVGARYREHILSTEKAFYLQSTHSIYREHILSTENTFYLQSTHSIYREHNLASTPH
jgi:hypothetical protein